MLAWSLLFPAPFADEPGVAIAPSVLVSTPAPPVYRLGAIFRDVATGADGFWDLTRSDAIYAADEQAIAQQCNLRLQTQRGERFDDQDLGVDYAGAVLGVGRTQGGLSAAFRDAILSVPGIRALTRLNISGPDADGRLTVAWAATCDLGVLVSGQTIVNGGG